MPPKTIQYGPKFVRTQVIALEKIDTESPETGWREPNRDRVKELTLKFLGGSYGLGVTCGVQIMEKESARGQKLIDDGVSTVAALKECAVAYERNNDLTPDNQVWSESLVCIFRNGLAVRVAAFTDNDDREQREAWNTAKHDEEGQSVRWSTLYQKLTIAVNRQKKCGDWKKVKTSLVDLYGPAKESTVGRWVRAAKGVSQEVMETFKDYEDLKGTFVWDNPYIVACPSNTRNQLGAQYAVSALTTLRERNATPEPLSAHMFQEKICKPMKIVEVWRALMVKRYGCVASNSPALERLTASLTKWGGLQAVSRCAQSGVILHGVNSEQQGIPDCWLLKNEFDKCVAGGLPPPLKIPTEQEARALQEQRQKALQEQRQAEQESERKEEEKQRILREQALTSSLTEEADLMMLTTPRGDTGVSAGPPLEDPFVKAAREKRERAAALLLETSGRVSFCDTPDALLTESKDALQTAARAFILVEAPTTSVSSFSHLLEVAKNVSELYIAGSGNGGQANQTKIRILVLVGRRHELIAKTEDRGSVLWPHWYQMVVQLKKRDTQSQRVRPGYAVVITPVKDVSHEPISISLPKVSAKMAANQRLILRCTEANCPYRLKALSETECKKVGENDEIEAEDRINILDSMMDEAQEHEEGSQSQEAGGEADADDMEVEAKHDCIVNLWPYANTTMYYQEVLCSLASADKASACCIVSTTAHPSHWVACASSFALQTYVLTRRWSNHSAKHGRTLGTQLLQARIGEEVGGAGVSAAPSKKEAQCILGVVVEQPQVIEAYDVHQGACWHDGLNRSIPVDVLGKHATDLIRCEADANGLRITGVQPNKGRGLETLTARRDGDVICGASALFWDDWNSLLEFVRLPGNARFGDRVVQIDNVMRAGEDVTIWAVLVGVCQFAQHYEGIRPRANCVLEFNASRGFNNGVTRAGLAGVSAAALSLKVATRNGAGVSTGSPLLLNYGVSFDLSAAASSEEGSEFKGALDALFEAQRPKLPDDAEMNQARALQEKQAEAERASAEAAQKEQDEQNRKRKLEEEAKQQEDDAKRQKLEEAEQARVAEAVQGEGVKPKLDFVANELLAPKASFGIRGGKLVIVSSETTNKKIPKDTVVMSWTNDVGVKADECATQEWDINLKSEILWKDTMKRLKLDKLMKEVCPQVAEIWKYTPFPAGTLPKVLVKKEPQKSYGFMSKAPDKEIFYKIIKLARACTSVSVVWILKGTPVGKVEKLEPSGLAIVLNKQLVLLGSGELEME